MSGFVSGNGEEEGWVTSLRRGTRRRGLQEWVCLTMVGLTDLERDERGGQGYQVGGVKERADYR